MAISDSLSGASGQLEKLIKQLSQIEDLADSITSKTKGLGTSIMGSVGSAGSVMPGGAQFSSQTTTSTTQQTTSNGMPVPTFGQRMAGAALAVGSVAVGAAKFAWDMTPATQDAYLNQNMLFQAGFMSTGNVNNQYTAGRIRAAFGNTATGNFDQQAAAVLLGSRGMGINSSSFGRVAGEAGFMSRLTGMSNVQTAAGSSAMQFGGSNVTGKLSQYGIFTNDLATGQYGGMGKVIDQLWARWYGSKSAKVPEAVFEADLMGGFLGRDLQYFFGNDQQLYQMVVAGLRLKAKNSGMAGIDFSENARGPRSAKTLAAKVGMNEFQNPINAQMRSNSSAVDLLMASTDPMMKGFVRATDTIVTINEKLTEIAKSPWGQWMLEQKAYAETVVASQQGLALFNAALAAATGLLSALAGSSLFNAVKGVASGGKAASGAKHAAPKTATGAGSLLGKAGVVAGVVTAGIETLYNGKQAWDTEGWVGLQKYGTQLGQIMSPQGIYSSTMAGWNATQGSNGPMDWVLNFMQGANPLRYRSEDAVRRAVGGYGTTTSDSINARLSKGEYVINARAAQKLGRKQLDALNSTGHEFGSAYASPAKAFNNGGAVDWINPFPGSSVSSPYGDPNRDSHVGIDLNFPGSADTKEWVLAMRDGVVTEVTISNSVGGQIRIKHDGGYETRYIHLNYDSITVKVGDRVKAGQRLALVGAHGVGRQNTGSMSSGPHLHLEAKYRGRLINPANLLKGAGVVDGHGSTDPLSSNNDVLADTQQAARQSYGPGPSVNAIVSAMMGQRSALSNPMSTYMSMAANPMTVFGAPSMTGANLGVDPRSIMSGKQSSSDETSVNHARVKGGKGGAWLMQFLYKKGLRGDKLKQIWALGMRESGGSPGVDNAGLNRNGSTDYGLWQINSVHEPWLKETFGWTMEDMRDPNKNFRAMWRMSQHGKKLGAWNVGPDAYDKANSAMHTEKWQDWMSQFDKYAKDAGITAYAHGTDYVSRSGTARVHEGEMIIPASQATDFREALREALSGTGRGTTLNVNLTIEKASDEEADRFVKRVVEKLRYEEKQGRLRNR